MDRQAFEGQMRRLSAAYRIEVKAPTIAAYWLAFQKTPDAKFATACERAIEHETMFPSIAAIKEILRHRQEVAPPPATMIGTGSVGCLTCMDAGFVRRDVLVAHPDFGKLIPCPHCEGASKPRNLHAEGMASVQREHEIRAELAPYREEQAARHRFAPANPAFLDAEPPPEGYAMPVREMAERVAPPFCITPFVIVPKADGGRRGFVAQWANASDRSKRADACEWRESREAIRAAMVNRYADVQEVKA